MRLEAAFAAAGDRIGLPHLALTGVAAAGVTVLFAEKIMGLQPAVVVLIGTAAAVAAPMALLRLCRAGTKSNFSTRFPMRSI